MVCELISGGNLKEYIKINGPLPENLVALILKNILEGLKYLHNKNIMHRDIKPENILFRTANIKEPNQIVLTDFGFATYNDVKEYLFPKCGTPGFVAPEIYAHKSPEEHYGLKCDLFSVGVTMYFMLTAVLPYTKENNLIKKNKECHFDFYNFKAYKTLSKHGFFCFLLIIDLIEFFYILAQNLILNLICKQNQRFDVNQTLNHKFFFDKEFTNDDEDLEILSNNLQEFNQLFIQFNLFIYFIFLIYQEKILHG